MLGTGWALLVRDDIIFMWVYACRHWEHCTCIYTVCVSCSVRAVKGLHIVVVGHGIEKPPADQSSI